MTTALRFWCARNPSNCFSIATPHQPRLFTKPRDTTRSFLWQIIQIVMFSATACVAHANDLADRWLQVLPGYVQGVFLDAGNGEVQPVLDVNAAVVVTSSANNRQEKVAQSRLFNFVNGKELLTSGCLMGHLDALGRDDVGVGPCDRLGVVARRTLALQFQTCQTRTSEAFQSQLFVTHDLMHSRCLVKQLTSVDTIGPTGEVGVWFKSRLEIENRLLGGGREVEVMGQHAYMRIEGDKIFDCPKLGTPTTYRFKKMPEELAKVGLKELRKTNPFERNAELFRHPSQIFFEPPAWQNQYLIKTRKFKYSCWDALRNIDQPGEVGLLLDDNTALILGSVSVLRIRLVDGSTEASKKDVHVYDAAEVGALLKRLDDSCPDTCRFADIGGYKSIDRIDKISRGRGALGTYYRHVIQGIDSTLLKKFSQSNN